MAVTNLFGALALDATAQAILTKLGYLATSAGLTALGGKLDTIAGKLDTTASGLKVDGSAVTQPVSAASLPLPDGAATDAAIVTLGDQLEAATALAGERTSTGEQMVMLSEAILSRLGWPDQSTGSIRVLAAGGSLGTVTTVSTVTNQAQMAGFSTVYDQYAAMLSCAAANRARITVT